MKQSKEIKAKLDENKKVWDLDLCNFLLYGHNFISGRELGTRLPSPNFEIFLYFLIPKIPSLKSLGNSWGNSYTKFIILEIKSRVTCSESNLDIKMLVCLIISFLRL